MLVLSSLSTVQRRCATSQHSPVICFPEGNSAFIKEGRFLLLKDSRESGSRVLRIWFQGPTNFYTQAEITVLSLKGLKKLSFKVAYAGCFSTPFHLPSCPMAHFSLAQSCAGQQSGSNADLAFSL